MGRNRNLYTLSELDVGDEFQDTDIATSDKEKLCFKIIGDHVYVVTNNLDCIIVARDIGNGWGIVMSKTEYNVEEGELKKAS